MLAEVKQDWSSLRTTTPGPEDVIWAYRTFLAREPSEEDLVRWDDLARTGLTYDDMTHAFISCDEFRARTPPEQIEALTQVGTGQPPLFPLTAINAVTAALTIPAFRTQAQQGSFQLPSDFNHTLPPLSDAYQAQQLRLWSVITQREHYQPEIDEDTPEIAYADAIHRPGFYAAGDSFLAGDHLMALGHILRQSALKAGQRALEYGAGFGQIALAFARCGVQVDTVDINKFFSDVINKAAAHHNAPLTAHVGPFGFNPAGHDEAYDLIYFYESFHHCFDFKQVIPMLFKMLKPGGKVFMAGEPIAQGPTSWMPYPWGIRLDGECISIMRHRGWMELGFQEDFLISVFEANGFVFKKYPLEQFHYCPIYSFERPL